VLASLEPGKRRYPVIPADSREFGQLRRSTELLHIPLREDWAQTLLLVRGESFAPRGRLCISHGRPRGMLTRTTNHATLGRDILDHEARVNNALTSMLGNAELLLLIPELSSHRWHRSRPINIWRCESRGNAAFLIAFERNAGS